MLEYGEDLKQTATVSPYQPSKEVCELTSHVKKDFWKGSEILNTPARELNYYSVIDRMNKDQRTFNALVDESVEDPNEAWKWRGTRSTARKKTMAMHAKLTQEYVVPSYFPDNNAQKIDQEVGNAMRDGVDWMTIHSNYRPMFLLATMGMLVNPVTYLRADYCEVTQKIWERDENGVYNRKVVLDDVLSGFQASVMSADQVLLTNQYVQEVQRQTCVITNRYIPYEEAKAKYEKHDNWQYVTPGTREVFNVDDGLFYNVKDTDHADEVQESIHMCRRNDCEEPFINGIYMGNSNVEINPMKHRDNEGKPKYNFVPFGFQRINEHYFFYKSQVNLLSWDDQLIDAMYEMTMNKELIDLDEPTVIAGSDKVDTSVHFPGAVVASEDPNFTAKPIFSRRANNGYQAIEFAEKSASDESVSETEMGTLPDASQKAFTVAEAAANAKILMGGTQKSIGASVAEFGYLMGDIFINHFTTAQLDEISGDLKYREFLLEDQMVNGRKVSKRLRFDESLAYDNMTEEDKKMYRMKLLKEVGYPDHKEEIMVINPLLFSKLKYICRCEPDMLEPKNRRTAQIMAERVYTLTSKDPNANPEALLRNLYNEYYPKYADELMAKTPQIMGGSPMQQALAGSMPAMPTNNAPREVSQPVLP